MDTWLEGKIIFLGNNFFILPDELNLLFPIGINVVFGNIKNNDRITFLVPKNDRNVKEIYFLDRISEENKKIERDEDLIHLEYHLNNWY